MATSPLIRRALRTAGAILVAGATVSCSAAADDDDPAGDAPSPSASGDTSADAEPSGHRSWLEPRQAISVGRHRYVSACQLLTPADLEERVFTLPTTFEVVEEYLDTSLPHDQFAAEEIDLAAATSCEYLFDWYDRPSVGLEVIHAVEAGDAALELPPADVARRELAAMRRAAGDGSDEVTSSLLEQMDEGLQAIREADGLIQEADGLVTAYDPIGDGLGVMAVRGPVVVKLYYAVPSGTAMGDSETALAVADLASYLDTALDRLEDPELSQAPAPTVLGDTGMLGSTPMVEPCHVLDDQAFEAAIGVPPNGTVRRETYAMAPVVSAGSSCTRQYGASQVPDGAIRPAARRFGDGGYATVSLELVAYPDRSSMMTDWKKLRNDPAGIARVVRTRADSAILGRSRLVDGPPIGFFRVGPYSAITSLDMARVEGFLGEPVTLAQQDAQLVRAINRMAQRLRQDLAEADGEA